MERTIEVDKRQRAVTAHYTSVDHPVKPPKSGIVRGETSSSTWHFKVVGNGKTLVEVESQVREADLIREPEGEGCEAAEKGR